MLNDVQESTTKEDEDIKLAVDTLSTSIQYKFGLPEEFTQMLNISIFFKLRLVSWLFSQCKLVKAVLLLTSRIVSRFPAQLSPQFNSTKAVLLVTSRLAS